MNFTFHTTSDKLYITFLQTINGVLGLTDMEIVVLASFLSDPDTTSREIRASSLGISVPNLNNIIKKLRDKKMLTDTEEGLQVFNKLRSFDPYSESITFNFNLIN